MLGPSKSACAEKLLRFSSLGLRRVGFGVEGAGFRRFGFRASSSGLQQAVGVGG